MTLKEVMTALEKMGNEGTKNVLMKHGAKEPFFGVRVGDMKTLVKKIKKDHSLALELFKTGNSDAMYLAALIADPVQFTKKDLNEWAKKAYWYMISEYTVAWMAAESRYGWELGLEWIESDKENIACSGWSTLSNLVALKPDEELDIPALKKLVARVKKELPKASNRVRYTMNGFIISVGAYVKDLTDLCKKTAADIGKVSVEMGGTSCKVPFAPEYIEKIEKMGRIGKKKKTVVC